VKSVAERRRLARPSRCLVCQQPNEDGHVCEARRVMVLEEDSRGEAEFQRNIVRQAKEWGWKEQHNTIAYRSPAGWPDLYMVRGSRVVIAELKLLKGKVSPEQAGWLLALAGVPWHEVFVWRPGYWHQIHEVLAPVRVSPHFTAASRMPCPHVHIALAHEPLPGRGQPIPCCERCPAPGCGWGIIHGLLNAHLRECHSSAEGEP
jgi:hypothetical protein